MIIVNYIKFFLVLVSILFVIGGTGRLCLIVFLNVRNSKPFFTLFISILSGVVIFVTIFSIIQTHFRTVNLLFVLLFILLLIFKKQNIFRDFSLTEIKRSLIDYTRNFLKYFILLLPLFLTEALFLLKNAPLPYNIPFVDYIDMNNISNIITQTGCENNKYLTANFYYPRLSGISPYHYFELWYNGLLFTVFPFPGLVTLMLFVYPAFYFLTLLGVISVWELLNKVNFPKILISYLLLFLGLLNFEFYDKIALLVDHGLAGMQLFFFASKKLSVLYPFILLTLILFFRNRKFEASLVLIAVCICSVGVLPGVLGGLFLFVFTNKIHRSLLRHEVEKIFFSAFVFTVAFAALYFLFGSKNDDGLGLSSVLVSVFNSLQQGNLKTVFFRIVIPAIKIAIMFSPFLLLSFWVLIRNRDRAGFKEILNLIFLFFLILFTGLITGGFAISVFSGEQFFYDLLPFLYIFVIFLFIYEFRDIARNIGFHPFYKGIIFIIIAACLIQNAFNNFKTQNYYCNISESMYSNEYLNSVTSCLDKNKNKLNHLGVCFFSQNDIDKYPLDSYGLTGITFTGISLKFANSFSTVTNLSIFDINVDTSFSFNRSLFNVFEFYTFVKNQKQKNMFISTDQSKMDFIKENKIDFAVIYKNAEISEELEKNICFTIKDSKSGERFVIFGDRQKITGL